MQLIATRSFSRSTPCQGGEGALEPGEVPPSLASLRANQERAGVRFKLRNLDLRD